MKLRGVCTGIGLMAGLVAISAILGGVAMLVGTDQFPLAWLQGTPFHDYTVPALLLVIVVGGSSFIAAVAILSGGKFGLLASMAAGLILTGYIVVEILILKQVPPGPTQIEVFYFGLGILVFGLAAYLWWVEFIQSKRTV